MTMDSKDYIWAERIMSAVALVVAGLFLASFFSSRFVMPFSIALVSYMAGVLGYGVFMLLSPLWTHRSAIAPTIRAHKLVTGWVVSVIGLVLVGGYLFVQAWAASNITMGIAGLVFGAVSSVLFVVVALHMDKE